jgi:hypothetical protein
MVGGLVEELSMSARDLLERASAHVDGHALVGSQTRGARQLVKRGLVERVTTRVIVVTDAGLAAAKQLSGAAMPVAERMMHAHNARYGWWQSAARADVWLQWHECPFCPLDPRPTCPRPRRWPVLDAAN